MPRDGGPGRRMPLAARSAGGSVAEPAGGSGADLAARSPARPEAGRAAGAAAVAALACALLASAAAPAPAGAQAPGQVDQGSYELRVDGRRVGTEAFAVRRQGQGVRAVGRISLDADAAGLVPMEAWLQTDGDFRPDLFRLRPREGALTSVTAVREGERFRVQTSSDAGDRYKEYLASPELSVLDPRVAHHFFLVLRQHRQRLEGGGLVDVPAILPARGERVTMTMRRDGPEQVEAAGTARDAVRYTVDVGGEEIRVWTDEAGRVLRVERPAARITSVRTREEP